MAEQPRLTIRNWHAHIYFDAQEAETARLICEAMRDALDVPMGRVHALPVGPHPRGSCQMTISRPKLALAIEWLVANRRHFTVFMHGNSGDDWIDHIAHVLWLGPSEPLRLEIFRTDRSEA